MDESVATGWDPATSMIPSARGISLAAKGPDQHMKLSNPRRAGAAALGLGALLAGVVTLASNAAAAGNPSGPARSAAQAGGRSAASQSVAARPATARTPARPATAQTPARPATTDRFWSGTDSN